MEKTLLRHTTSRCSLAAAVIIAMLCARSPVAAQDAPPPDDDPRVARVLRQIEATHALFNRATNEAARAAIQERLFVLTDEHESGRRRIAIEQRKANLASQRSAKVDYALRELLGIVKRGKAAPQQDAIRARKKIVKLREEHSDLEGRLRRLRGEPSPEATEVEEADKDLRNKEEEIFLAALERDAGELAILLATEADRIEDKIGGLPLNPPLTIRQITEKHGYIKNERSLRDEKVSEMERLRDYHGEITALLALSDAQRVQYEQEIEVLRRKRSLSRDKQLSSQLDEQRRLLEIYSEGIDERVALYAGQIAAIDAALEVGTQLIELYTKETEVLRVDLAALVRRYRVSILWPTATIAAIFVLQFLVSRLLLPLLYKRDTLFVARRLAGYLAFLCVLLVLALFFLEDLRHIATVLGIAGAALVIALQDLCSSFAGWFVIVTSRKVRVGDRIEVEDKIGDVVDIQLLRTTLLELNNWLGVDEPTGRFIIIPNSFIFKSKVINYSHVHPFIWNRIDIIVTFETPAQEAEELLRRILVEETKTEFEEARHAPADMEQRYGVADTVYEPKLYSTVADSGVLYSLMYVTHYKRRIKTRNRINTRIVHEFDTNPKMEFAYPTQRHIPTAGPGDLHVSIDRGAGTG